MGRLLGMARPTQATILLLGHPNKAGTSPNSLAAAPGRTSRAPGSISVQPSKNGDDDEPDLNDPRRRSVAVQGKLVGQGCAGRHLARRRVPRRPTRNSMTMADRCELRAKEVAAESAFLDALDKLTEQRRHTSHSLNAMNFAPKVMVEARPRRLAHQEGAGRAAMERLFSDGTISAAKPISGEDPTGIASPASAGPTALRLPRSCNARAGGRCAVRVGVPLPTSGTHHATRITPPHHARRCRP